MGRALILIARELVTVIDVEPGLVYDWSDWRIFAGHMEHGHGLELSLKE